MYRLLIADDNPRIRSVIIRLVREEFRTMKISEAENGEEAIQKIRSDKFDLLILDISMPVKSGVGVLRNLRDEYIGIPVIVISSFPVDQYGEVCIKLGASTFLTKQTLDVDLLPAIRFILSGSTMIRKPRIENDFSVN